MLFAGFVRQRVDLLQRWMKTGLYDTIRTKLEPFGGMVILDGIQVKLEKNVAPIERGCR